MENLAVSQSNSPQLPEKDVLLKTVRSIYTGEEPLFQSYHAFLGKLVELARGKGLNDYDATLAHIFWVRLINVTGQTRDEFLSLAIELLHKTLSSEDQQHLLSCQQALVTLARMGERVRVTVGSELGLTRQGRKRADRPVIRIVEGVSSLQPTCITLLDELPAELEREPTEEESSPPKVKKPRKRKKLPELFGARAPYASVAALAESLVKTANIGVYDVGVLAKELNRARRKRGALSLQLRSDLVELVYTTWKAKGEAYCRKVVGLLTREFPPDEHTPDYLVVRLAKRKPSPRCLQDRR